MHDTKDLTSEVIPLSALGTGERAIIDRVAIGSRLRLRLREMGFVPGTVVDVVRSAPLADPVEYKIKGYYISLRRQEAKDILVRKLNGKHKRRRFRFGWKAKHQKD